MNEARIEKELDGVTVDVIDGVAEKEDGERV